MGQVARQKAEAEAARLKAERMRQDREVAAAKAERERAEAAQVAAERAEAAQAAAQGHEMSTAQEARLNMQRERDEATRQVEAEMAAKEKEDVKLTEAPHVQGRGMARVWIRGLILFIEVYLNSCALYSCIHGVLHAWCVCVLVQPCCWAQEKPSKLNVKEMSDKEIMEKVNTLF